MFEAPILAVEDLDKRFRVPGGLFAKDATVQAVVKASLTVQHRGSLGLVGESGCGKSTLARCLLRLVEPDGGRIVFEGKEVRQLGGADLRAVRRRMQMIFQDPYASLNPRRTVAQTLAEPLRVHRLARGKEVDERVEDSLAEVGLPLDSRSRFPHEFSGGQRQRIGIARALILEPSFIVADEPVSALDVSVQAQVLKLLESLRERRALSMLFVSHDLGVVRHVCDRVAVMYLGRIVEEGPVPGIFDQPLHPYTQMLRAASPVPDPKARFALQRVTGEIPSAMNPPPGCAFSSRCPHVMPRCREEVPMLRVVESGRKAACHLLDSPASVIGTANERRADAIA
jgi:oligopeptide/dipeptide ABC transporter ATP-binding protein